LLRASDGNFYGTDQAGNTGFNIGAAFRLDPTLSFGVVHGFEGASNDGYAPVASLAELSGYMYGTSVDGINSKYMIFRMDFVGNVKAMADFDNGSCCNPIYERLRPAFGYVYGVTDQGGANGKGSIFRMDTAGNFSTVHSFNGTDGNSPDELILASDGNLYGVTQFGGTGGFGTVFRSDSAGNVTTLYDFSGSPDGDQPNGGLTESSGYLYGTTLGGGTLGFGTAFRIDFSGNLTILHNFAGSPSEGSNPSGSLVTLAGDLYGTTYSGGQYSAGTLFQMDSSNAVTTLHHFGGAGDSRLPGRLLAVEGPILCLSCPRRLIGATSGDLGFGDDMGSVFSFDFSPLVIVRLVPTAGPVRVAPGDPVQIHGEGFPVGALVSVTIGGLPATDVQVLDSQTISALTPVDLPPGTLNDVSVTSPAGTEETIQALWLGDFLDVPATDPRHDFVEKVFRDRIMDACGGGNFCEGTAVDRAAITMIALKARHGSGYTPPACTGEFRDVPCPGPEADWVEDAVAEGIAQPCSRNRFCPDKKLTRETLPEILLLTEHGSAYVPPSCTGIFKDVPCPGPNADAIEQVYREGIVEACSSNGKRYCSDKAVDRGPMAEYAAKAFRLP
jgi:uncharacterized repeat protein (TIGR03803 family)